MHSIARRLVTLTTVAVLATVGACAALQQMIQPPIFEMAAGHNSQLRLLGPGQDRPLGGAELRIWARVQNPNSFGFTLTRLAGNLLLEGQNAAAVDLPLGLPLPAAGDTLLPIDISISFADIPNLANQIVGALTGQRLDYALHGTLGVDASPFGTPTFGPSTWLTGEVQLIR